MPNDGTEQRKLAAIMFTDMVGYSALSQKNEALALELLEEHRRQLRPIFAKHHGTEIKTIGDAFLIEFHSPVEAVRSAIAMQRALREHNQTSPPERQVRIRIGVHLGDVVHRGGDVYGDGVNIASRIEPLAEPGGICVTQQVYDHVHNKLDAPIIELGKGELKNIHVPVNIYRVALPWESDHSPVSDRLAFAFRQKRVRMLVTVATLALIYAAVNLVIYRQRFSDNSDHSKSPVTNLLIKTAFTEIPSIAVLPFDNFSAKQEESDYLSGGMTEEITGALSGLTGLKVAGRTSAFRFKEQDDIRRIGQELNVKTVLKGSVTKDGSKLRVAVQLINVGDGFLLWSTNYDREITDLLAIRSEVAQRVAEALKIELGVADRQKLAKKPTENPAAHALYLQGRFYWNKRTAQGLMEARKYFQEAIDKDQNYALAYAGLADCYSHVSLNWTGATEAPKDTMEIARKWASKAIELDSTLAEAHVAMAFVHFLYDWDWPGAKKEFDEALRLNPKSGVAHHWHSHYFVAMRQFPKSLEASRTALELEPVDPVISVHLAWHYMYAGEPEPALKALERALPIEPGFFMTHRFVGLTYLQKSMYPEALLALNKAAELSNRTTEILGELGYALARSGDQEKAREILDELINRSATQRYVSAYHLGVIHAGLGDNARAVEHLQKAYDERFESMVNLRVEPLLESLRSNPEFQKLVDKMKFPK